MVIKKDKVEEHRSGKSHFFTKKEYKKHSYLAVPERCVLKEGDGTPVDASVTSTAHPEAMGTTPNVTASILDVACNIASESRRSPTDFITEQVQALQESEAMKEKAENEKLAASFGITADEFKAQQEQYRRLERQQSEIEQKSGTNEQGQHHFTSGQGDVDIQNYTRSPRADRKHASTFDRQGSVEHQAAQPISPHLVPHKLEVGTAVELVDPPGYGTIRWIGRFPGVDQDIAGVEMVSCAIHARSVPVSLC